MFDQAIADKICAHLAAGNSLRSWCRENRSPAMSEIFKHLRLQPAFAEQYTRALEDRADALSDDITEIADDPALDPNDKRVRVDARKWVASKLRPKKYGDRVIQEHDGKMTIEIVDATSRKE